MTGDRYQINKSKIKNLPTIILFPPAIGVSAYDYAISHYFRRVGFNVIIIPLEINIRDENLYIEDLDTKNALNIEKIKGTLDILPNLPMLPHSENIFAMGVSLGGMAAVFAFELEPRIKSALIYMGGSTVKDILESVTMDGSVKNFIAKHYRKLNFETNQEFREYLDYNFLFDLDVIPYVRDSKDILMFISLYDYTVNTELQFKLREDLNYPDYYPIYGPHHYGALVIPFKLDKITDYFRKKAYTNQ